MFSSFRFGTTTVILGLLLWAPSSQAQDSSPTGPTFPNIAANCNAYHTVVEGDICGSIAQTYGITAAQFNEWNPDIADGCATNFWLGYAYCVGVGTPASSTSSIASSSESITTSETTSSGIASPSITLSFTTTNTEPYSTLHPITNYTITPTTVVQEFPPTKTQPGQPADCNDWYLTTAFDTCDSIVAINSWLTKGKL